jgi:hypothetical protein
LREINANSKWITLANSTDERIALEALKYLTDRAYGRARQSIQQDVNVNGTLELAVAERLASARRRVRSNAEFPDVPPLLEVGDDGGEISPKNLTPMPAF